MSPSKAPEQTLLAELEIRIEATPEDVFPYLVEPEKMMRWMGKTIDATVEAGGAFRIEVVSGATAIGEYVRIEEPTYVSYTWGWDPGEHPMSVVPPGSSLVEFMLRSDGDATIVTLRHSGLPNEEQVAGHAHGWAHYLHRLQVAGAGGDPGPDLGPQGTPQGQSA